MPFRIKSHAVYVLAPLVLVTLCGGVYWWFFSLPEENADTFTGEYNLVLTDYSGNPVELSEFKRELLVVHAWASWCPYCADELKNLALLKQQFGDDITILAINRAEPESEARAFTDALGIDASQVQLLFDPDDAFFKSIGGYAMPETIFINARGKIIFHQRGPMDIDAVASQIKILTGRDNGGAQQNP